MNNPIESLISNDYINPDLNDYGNFNNHPAIGGQIFFLNIGQQWLIFIGFIFILLAVYCLLKNLRLIMILKQKVEWNGFFIFMEMIYA